MPQDIDCHDARRSQAPTAICGRAAIGDERNLRVEDRERQLGERLHALPVISLADRPDFAALEYVRERTGHLRVRASAQRAQRDVAGEGVECVERYPRRCRLHVQREQFRQAGDPRHRILATEETVRARHVADGGDGAAKEIRVLLKKCLRPVVVNGGR